MIKEKLYVWSCDYSNKTGEGNLARLFSKEINNRFNLLIKTPENIALKNKLFSYKYCSPFIGVIFCWYSFLLKKKTCYINYLPMWNFILFLFLPPATILGPVTGGSNYKNSGNFIRKFIFPIFYKITEFILIFRKSDIIFATDLLKKNLSKTLLKKSKFNFIFKAYNPKKPQKKNIDFVIYYRKHANKEKFFPRNFISNIVKKKYKIHIVGDYLNISGVKNHGRVNQNKINMLLSKSKYSIGSGENLYTLFTLDCINNNVKILIDKNISQNTSKFKKYFKKVNFESKQIFSYF